MECKFFPYERKEIANIQELVQVPGWQITAFEIPETWSFANGEGISVAVLDTGCDLDHIDLAENILEGYNVLNTKEKPEDDNDHGTHITGCICAEDNGYGVVGVAPKAKVVPIKVLDRYGSGNMKNIAKGVSFAIEYGVDMMCISIGSMKPLASLRKAIQKAYKKGIPIFCACGNISKDMDALYPARYPETIAIAALTKDFHRANFSNTSKNNIDFLAPGVDIKSTIRNDWYAVFSGSSMAAPFATGVAALLASAKRHRKLPINLLTVEDYKNSFREHAVDLSSFNDEKIFSGYGIIEPKKMVQWLKTSIPLSDPVA